MVEFGAEVYFWLIWLYWPLGLLFSLGFLGLIGVICQNLEKGQAFCEKHPKTSSHIFTAISRWLSLATPVESMPIGAIVCIWLLWLIWLFYTIELRSLISLIKLSSPMDHLVYLD